MGITPSEVVERLKGILLPSAIISEPVLQETNPEGSHDSIAIRHADDALFVSFEQWFRQHKCFGNPCNNIGDLADWLYPLFRRIAGLKSSSDYLCFVARENVLWVVMFELKNNHTDAARRQIASTSRLAEYLIAVALRDVKEIDWPLVEYREVVVNELARAMKSTGAFRLRYERDSVKKNLGYATLKRRKRYPLELFLSNIG